MKIIKISIFIIKILGLIFLYTFYLVIDKLHDNLEIEYYNLCEKINALKFKN